MKITMSALIAITFTAVLSNAGELGFMTSEGETSLKDNSKIESIDTTVEETTTGERSIGLYIKDVRGRKCHVSTQSLPNVDLVALAFNLKNSSSFLTCKIDNPNFPSNNEVNSAKAIWITVK